MADQRLLIGTTKGLFILDSDGNGEGHGDGRQDWALSGPHCDLWPINHAIGEPGTGHLWAAGGGAFHGAGVWHSADGGGSWDLTKLANGQSDDWAAENPEVAAQVGITPSPPAPFSGEIDSIWSLARVNGRLWAGSRPATLFWSEDGGGSWSRNEALKDLAAQQEWQPGAAGLTLHCIAIDPEAPERMWLGISAAGVFASEDGGQSWERRNRRSNTISDLPAHPAAGSESEIGHCVHHLKRAPGDGDLLYQQNHHGVWRSRDGGRSWDAAGHGLPSTFGFPLAVHPRDPQVIWSLPLNGDSAGRYPPEARALVWRSRDGGDSWEGLGDGLPQRDCYFTVLRQAMAGDEADPAGLYFGTNSGSVFASRDEGDSWQEIASHLPCVLSVEVVAR